MIRSNFSSIVETLNLPIIWDSVYFTERFDLSRKLALPSAHPIRCETETIHDSVAHDRVLTLL